MTTSSLLYAVSISARFFLYSSHDQFSQQTVHSNVSVGVGSLSSTIPSYGLSQSASPSSYSPNSQVSVGVGVNCGGFGG